MTLTSPKGGLCHCNTLTIMQQNCRQFSLILHQDDKGYSRYLNKLNLKETYDKTTMPSLVYSVQSPRNADSSYITKMCLSILE